MSEPWDTKAIGECLQTSFAGEWGGAPNPPNARVYRATDIDDEGRIIGEGAERRLPRSKLDPRQLIDGDILLEGSGGGPDKPVGRVAYFDAAQHPGSAVCSNFFKTLRPKRDVVDPRFLFRKLLWFYKQPELLAFQQQTTGIINLKFSEYLESSIDIPESIKEQAKIAKVLDTLDTAIAQTEAIIAKLKAVKQGLLHDLLTRGIDANGELRPPQGEAPQLYKQSALGWIPREWEVGTVASMTEILDSQRVPVNEVERMKRPGIVPYYGANGQQGWIDRPLFNEPLILLAEDGGNFDDFTWRPIAYRIDGESWVNNHAHVLRSKPESNQSFIFFALEHRDIRKYISGGTRTKLTAGELKTIELQNPRVDEQVAIASRLEAVVQRVGMETAMREKLLKEKGGLMDDLLTGNVRVTPLLEAAAA